MTCSGGTDIVRVDFVDAYRYGRVVYASTFVYVIFDVFCVIGNGDDPIYHGLRF
jgi:hypothetical protein